MKLILTICFYCAFALLFCEESIAQNNNIEKAKQLWEKVIEAKGGRENLYAVKNLVVSNKSYSPFEDEKFQNSKSEELYILSGKWWSWSDERPGFTIGINQYDFESELGYEVTEDSKKPRIYKTYSSETFPTKNTEEIRKAKLKNDRFFYSKQIFLERISMFLMETKWFQPQIDGVRTKEIDGKKLEVIVILFGSVKVEYFIDPKTYLPKKWRRSVWFEDKKVFDVEDEFFLEDYIEVAGVKFPQIIRRTKKTETKTKYQVNVKYDENLFNKPPSIEAGADDWKPKQ